MSEQKTTNEKKTVKKDFNHLKRKNVQAAFSYLSVLIFTVVNTICKLKNLAVNTGVEYYG